VNRIRSTVSPRRICAGILVSGCLALLLTGCGKALFSEKEFGPTLRMTTARIRGFDPAHAGDQASVLAVGKVYEGLLQYSYWDRPYRVEPLLASALPEVSADGLVWSFTLRPGIYFSDDPCFVDGKGREVLAQDMAYSIQRIADVKIGSGGYWVFRGKIQGLDEFREASRGDEATDYNQPVAGLRVTGRYTFEIHLTQPYPQLHWVMAMPYAFVVAREAVERYGAEFVNHPVGTGPYVLVKAQQNYRYEYRVNPTWAETGREERMPADAPTPDAGKSLPLVKRIVDSVVGDPSTAWLMFLSGRLELIGVSRDHWDSIITPDKLLRPELAAKGMVLSQSPQLAVSYTAFNMDDPVVGPNLALRQALACAFDSEEWKEFQNGRMMIPNGPIPPGVAGTSDTPSPYPYNLDRARELLAEAGYPEGRDPSTGRRLNLILELGSADNPETRQGAELMASFMTRIGVVLQPSYNNWPAFLQKIERRQAQLFSLTWLGDYPDAQNFLQLFFSENVSPGPNRSNYHNRTFDSLYRELVALPESPERDALCQQASDVVLGDCPWILTAYPMAFTVRHQRLLNYQQHDFAWGMEKYWGLNP